MNTNHRWFRSGRFTLLGHLDSPPEGSGRLGVLIVPPFGWEEMCSYRPLRFLGQMLAARGFPTFRFDLPGTGDSSGDALSPGLFDAWVETIEDAAAELRLAANVERVAVLGIRFGAMLALSAAARGFDIQDLILWAPAASGRAVLREWRAFAKMEQREYATNDAVPPQPIPGFEAGGFLLAPETESALEQIKLEQIAALTPRRVLILSRDEVASDATLIEALKRRGCQVAVEAGYGYAAMMTLPHEAVPPAATGHVIANFLSAAESARGRIHREPVQQSPVVLRSAGIAETIYPLDSSAKPMFGILSEQDSKRSRSDIAVLFLNAGGVRHIGPNRMWVEAARRWALNGVPSLRLDLEGIGESDGEHNLDIPSLYQSQLVDQVEAAKRSLQSRLGVTKFAVVGLCAGAFWAFHLALRDPDIRLALLLNPRLLFWDSQADRRRVLWRVLNWADWRRVISGNVTRDTFRRAAGIVLKGYRKTAVDPSVQAAPETIQQALRALDSSGTRLTFMFTEGEPALRELEAAGHIPFPDGSRFRCERIANAGHTFRPLWAQALAHQIMDRELDQLLHESAQGRIVRAS